MQQEKDNKPIDDVSNCDTVSEMQEINRIRLLREKYLDDISSHEAHVRQIREKLKLLEEVEKDSDGIPLFDPAAPLKFASVGITKAIEDAVNGIGSADWVSAAQIRKYICANGYDGSGHNFPAITTLTLRRLVAGKRIQTKKDGSSRLYMANKK